MKQRNIVLTVLLCAALCLMMFTACQPNIGDTPTPGPSQSTEQGAPEPDEIAMVAGDEYKIFVHANLVENEWVNGEGSRGEDTRQRWIDFQEKYGVTITWVANTAGEAWIDGVMKPAAAGEPIADIFHMGGPFVIPLTLSFGGTSVGTYFEDLSKYSQYTNFDDNNYWDQSAMQSMGYYNGSLYVVVPHAEGWGAAAVNQVAFFNKKLIKEGGYEASDMYNFYKNGEWTFDKYKQVALDCTNVDKGFYGTTVAQNGMAILSMITANNAAVLETSEGGVPQFAADSANSLEAINFFLDMCKNDGSVCLENGVGQVEETLFKTGKVAIMLTYANRATNGEGPRGGAIYQQDGLEYGIILPPKGPKADDYRSDKNWASPFCVISGHSNPAGVAQCLSYYLCPETALGSAKQEMYLESEAQSYFQDEESIQTLKDAVTHNVTTSYMAYWQARNSEDLTLAVATTYQFERWVNGESTPENDYATFKDAVNGIIAGIFEGTVA